MSLFEIKTIVQVYSIIVNINIKIITLIPETRFWKFPLTLLHTRKPCFMKEQLGRSSYLKCGNKIQNSICTFNLPSPPESEAYVPFTMLCIKCIDILYSTEV